MKNKNMIESIKEKDLNLHHFLVAQNHSSILTKFKYWLRTSLFEVVMQVFPSHNRAHSSTITRILLMYIVSCIETFQLVSFLYYPKEDIRNWESFKNFWVFLSFSRFDTICAHYSALSGCFYFSISSIICLSFLIFWVVLQYFRSSAVSNLVIKILRIFWVLLSTVFYVPILCILIVTFKYSKTGQDYINEYDCGRVDFMKEFFQFESIFVCLLVVIGYFYHSLVYECRHKFSKLSVYARPHSKLEILRFFIHTIFTILYIFLTPLNKRIFHGLIVAFSIYLTFSYYKLRPFFCLHTNISRILTYSTLISFTFILEFGSFNQNSNYSFILTVFVLPILILIIWFKLWDDFKQPLGCPKSSATLYEFELRLRNKLINPNDHQEIIQIFSEIYNKTEYGKSITMKLWLSNFCFYSMENDSLTRIKLGIRTEETSSIDIKFQLFCLRKTVKTMPLEFHEDVEYVYFLTNYQNVKADDKKFCLLTAEFLQLFQNKQDCRFALNQYSEKIAEKIIKVAHEYKNLVNIYPQSVSAVEDFSSFYGSILNKDDKSVEMIKAKNKSKVNFEFSEFRGVSFFDENNGLIIISAAFQCFGIIVYANQAAGDILEEDLTNIIGDSINAYIPYPFDNKHNTHMKKYLLACSSSVISKPVNFIIQTKSNFIKECYVRISCTALDSDPFFTVLIREKSKNREIAVLTKKNLILSHSKNFPLSLGVSSPSLKNTSINEYIQNYIFQNLLENHTYPLPVQGNQQVSIIKSHKLVKQKKIPIVYIIPLETETLPPNPRQVFRDSNFYLWQNKDCTIFLENQEKDKKNSFMSKKYPKNVESEKILDSDSLNNFDLKPLNPIKTLGSSSMINNNTLSTLPIFENSLKLLKKFKIFFILIIIIIVSCQLTCSIVILKNYDLSVNDIRTSLDIAILLSDIIIAARSYQLGQLDPFQQTENLNDLKKYQSSLISLTNDFQNIIEHSNCKQEDLFFHSQEYNSYTKQNEFNEVYNILKHIAQNIDSIVNSYSDEACDYVIINSLRIAEKSEPASGIFSECKAKILKENEVIGNYLLIINIIVSATGFVVFLACFIKVERLKVEIFQIFYRIAGRQVEEVNQKILNRLNNVHGNSELQHANKDSEDLGIPKSHSMTYKYSWRFLLFFSIICSFYVLIYYKTIPNLKKITEFQPKVLENTYDARYFASILEFWVKERVLGDALHIKYTKSVLFLSPNQEIEIIRTNLKNCQKNFIKNKFLKLLEHHPTYQLLEYESGVLGGQYTMMNDIIFYSYEILSYDQAKEFQLFHDLIKLYRTTMENFSGHINDDIVLFYDIEEMNILVYSVLYFIAESVIFTMIFVRLLSAEYKKIESFRVTGEIFRLKSNLL